MQASGLRVAALTAVLGWGFTVPPAGAGGGRIRKPALAGTFYPESRVTLTAAARYLMRLAGPAPAVEGRTLALVVPHAAWPFSGLGAAAAFRHLRPGDFDRVVVLAPSHHGSFSGYALDDAAAYRTPLGDVPLCTGTLAGLRDGPRAKVRRDVAGPEHAIEVLLPFLQVAAGRFCLVPVLSGDTTEDDQRAFAARLAALDDGRTLFVVSSDLTHYGARYGFTPYGASLAGARDRVRALDERALALLGDADGPGLRAFLGETGATICGRHALLTLLELLRHLGPEMRPSLLAYYASADLPQFADETSVGYPTLAVLRKGAVAGSPLRQVPQLPEVAPDPPPVSAELGRRLARLARAAVQTEIFGGDALDRALAELPPGPEMERRQGLFVTLYRKDSADARTGGRLRGCQGQLTPTFPADLATVQAALEAAFRDSRFPRLTAAELPLVDFEVTLLSPPRPVASPREITLGTHGVAVQKEKKGALFLPQVPKQEGWDVDRTLRELCAKAELPHDGWRNGALFVFTGQAFVEER